MTFKEMKGNKKQLPSHQDNPETLVCWDDDQLLAVSLFTGVLGT
jgi:hypothetical protein